MNTGKEPANAIIAKFGGPKALAAVLGLSWPSVVQGWKRTGRIPAKHQQAVLVAAKKHGIDLKPEDFFDLSSIL